MKLCSYIISCLLFIIILVSAQDAGKQGTFFTPGKPWPDTDNLHINAHGGGILNYNTKTQKFVLWFHLELKGKGYAAARTGVAIADKPEGPYTYLKSYRPNAGVWPLNFPDAWKQPVPGEDTIKWWTEKWRKAIEKGLFIRRDFTEGQMSRD